jgi:streptogrisin D
VTRDNAELNAVAESLEHDARVPGTSWGVDPVTNKVVVTVDSSVTGAKLARVRKVAARLGDAVHIEHVAGVFSPHIAGGDAIYGGGYRCSLAFNVHDRIGKSFFLTAGHCGKEVRLFYADAGRRNLVGVRSSAYYPGDDYAIYHFVPGRTSNFGVINNRQDITRAGNAYVGQLVRRTGSSTGTRSGRVTAVNVTVNYSDGSRLHGMVRTDACSEPGDSGGPYYAGTTALGIHSGGSSAGCGPGATTTFFQPLPEVLARYEVHVY